MLIFKAFLPPYLWQPPFSEFVAYISLAGLALAAVGAWSVLRQKPPATSQNTALAQGRALLVLAVLGVFLAFGAYNPVYYLLYRAIPGFDLFRAPARWLLLYSFGAASLVSFGMEALSRLAGSRHRIRPGTWQMAIALLVVIELFLAGRRLAYNEPTSPAAYDSLRSAPGHLLASQLAAPTEPSRFLSLSDIGYDPGDMADLQAMYSDELSEDAIYDLIVASKMKEVLAFNLPLRYRLATVDGYDGGLLPIKQYVSLERLFLSEDEIWPDGRLRQQLRTIPPARLMALLGVEFVITDKTQDVWIDDVYYDLEHTVPLGRVTLTDLPEFETTHLGLVSYLADAADVPDGTPVGRVIVTDTMGSQVAVTLRAGEHTAEGVYAARPTAHRQASVGHIWRDNTQGYDYVTLLALGRQLEPAAISVEAMEAGPQLNLRGLSLVDQQTGTSRSLSVDPNFKLVHSGDVKVYEHLKTLPRAFVVHQARVIDDDEEALKILRDPAFDPAEEVILASGRDLAGRPNQAEVELVSYGAEEVKINARLESPGYLVVSDTHYPGWIASVNGQIVPIHRANLYFRAIALEPGEHEVIFRYDPASVEIGLGIGLFTWLVWLLAFAGVAYATMGARTGRKKTIEV